MAPKFLFKAVNSVCYIIFNNMPSNKFNYMLYIMSHASIINCWISLFLPHGPRLRRQSWTADSSAIANKFRDSELLAKGQAFHPPLNGTISKSVCLSVCLSVCVSINKSQTMVTQCVAFTISEICISASVTLTVPLPPSLSLCLLPSVFLRLITFIHVEETRKTATHWAKQNEAFGQRNSDIYCGQAQFINRKTQTANVKNFHQTLRKHSTTWEYISKRFLRIYSW